MIRHYLLNNNKIYFSVRSQPLSLPYGLPTAQEKARRPAWTRCEEFTRRTRLLEPWNGFSVGIGYLFTIRAHEMCIESSRQGIIQVRIPTVAASRRLWSRWQVSNTSVCASLAVVRTAGPLWHACMRAGAAGAQRFRICASPRLNGTYNTIDDAHHVKTVLLPNMLRDKYIYSRKKPGMRR